MNHYHFGLRAKAIFVLSGLLILALITMGGITYWQAFKLDQQQAIKVNLATTQRLTRQVESTIGFVRDDLLTLHDLPSEEAVRAGEKRGIAARDQDSQSGWKVRTQKIFAAFLRNNLILSQIRVLDQTGMEVVRVDSAGGKIRIVPDAELQNKAGRYYFQAASKLAPGRIYYSSMDMNREHGRIQLPHTPMFRMAMPMYNAQQRLRGVIVLNVFGESLLDLAVPDQQMNTYVVNQDGYFLRHPDSSREFGFDLGFQYRLKDEFPALAGQSREQDEGGMVDDSSSSVLTYRKLYFDPYDASRYWMVIHRQHVVLAFANIAATAHTMIRSGVLVSLLALLIILWLTDQYFISPIMRLAGAAQKMKEGDLSQRLPEQEVNDELRLLYETLNGFAETQQQATARLEMQIRERTEHLAGIVSNLVDGLVTIDERGIVLSYNTAAERIFGYGPDEVIGHNVSLLLPEPYRHQHDGYLDHYLKTGEKKVIGSSREVSGMRKDGSLFPLELAVSEMQSGGKRIFIGILRDISERKAAEQQIAEKNAELKIRASYDSSYGQIMGVFAATFDRNSALNQMLSLLATRHDYPVSAVYLLEEWGGELKPVARHGVAGSFSRTFAFGTGLVGLVAQENNIVVQEGTDAEHALSVDLGVVGISLQAVAICPISYQNKVTGVLVLASGKPFTLLKKSFILRLCQQTGVALHNIDQHESLVELSAQLKQRSEEIFRQNRELEQANRMKSEFLATMSHELRTPLNAIIGFSEMLRDGVMGALTAEQQEYTGDILDSGQHLLALINDILDLSKIEAGKMELNLQPVGITQLLENGLSIVRETAVAHNIALSLKIADGVSICQLDARKGKQILYNLLSNAVKFTPDGGSVSVSVRRMPGKNIHSTLNPQLAESKDDFLELQVTDTGIGISEQDQKKLFQAFVQCDSSLSRQFEGTGLGLALVKRLAHLHGGGVDLVSEPGKGSTFMVWLPYIEGREIDILSVSRMASVPTSGDGPLVMMIENEDAAAEFMRAQLESGGYRTCRAASAEAAWEMLPNFRPDLITLDILMPDTDGWVFLRNIKASENYSDIPVVIVSIVANQRKGFSLGAAEVLQKPVRKEELFAVLSRLGLDSENSEGTPKRILIADDDPKAVDFVSRYLQNAHFSVIKAYGGAEAIATALEELPDLILLDLMMPDVNGFDVVDAMKEYPLTALIPIIILTAKVVTAEDRNRLNSDIVKIVEKNSFNQEQFLAEVRMLLQKKRKT